VQKAAGRSGADLSLVHVGRPRSALWMQNIGTAQDRRCLPRLPRLSTVAPGRGCVLARCTRLRPARSSFLLVLLFTNFSDRGVYAVNNLVELPHLTEGAHAAGYQRVCRAFRVGQCLDGRRLTMVLHR